MISVKGLSLKLGDKQIIKNLNLEIEKGENLILNSSSGSGKTSFLRVLQGFLPVDTGEVCIDDILLNEKNIHEIRKKIAYVSQKVELPQGKTRDVLKTILNYSQNKNIEFNNLKEKLIEFNLDEGILEKDTKKISGGERQRLGFIICLYLNRDIWLLDEVTASLDYEMKKKVEEYIVKSPKTIILISHDNNWNLKNFREVKW